MNKKMILCLLSTLLMTGCAGLINKAKDASTERAEKFSDSELCEHAKNDGNIYYKEANTAELKKRELSCH